MLSLILIVTLERFCGNLSKNHNVKNEITAPWTYLNWWCCWLGV